MSKFKVGDMVRSRDDSGVIDQFDGTRYFVLWDCGGEGWFSADAIDAMRATTKQVGGDHYRDLAIQPVEYIHRNGLGWCEGEVVKYVTRWRRKNGVEDLRKAIHCLELLIELENTSRRTKEVTE